MFKSKRAYMATVVYPCVATEAYWNQAPVVLQALDKQYYCYDEFVAEYGEVCGSQFWLDARKLAQMTGDRELGGPPPSPHSIKANQAETASSWSTQSH